MVRLATDLHRNAGDQMSDAAVHPRNREATQWATAGNIALWTLQVAVAAFFIMGGIPKLIGSPEMIGLFEAIGVGQWLRYLTGALEVGGGILLVVPGRAGLGALVIAGVMVGAVATHLFIIGGSSTMALVFLAVSSIIAYGRRRQVVRVAGNLASAATRRS